MPCRATAASRPIGRSPHASRRAIRGSGASRVAAVWRVAPEHAVCAERIAGLQGRQGGVIGGGGTAPPLAFRLVGVGRTAQSCRAAAWARMFNWVSDSLIVVVMAVLPQAHRHHAGAATATSPELLPGAPPIRDCCRRQEQQCLPCQGSPAEQVPVARKDCIGEGTSGACLKGRRWGAFTFLADGTSNGASADTIDRGGCHAAR